MHAAFRILNPTALDDTFEAWLAVVLPIIAASRRVSARMAAAYLTAARSSAVGLDPNFTPLLAAEVPVDALRTSLLVTGPLSIKAAMTRGVFLDRAADVAEARSAAVAMRYTLAGGRETITATTRADSRAVGWERVASGKACQFCSSLAGKHMTDDDVFEAHDGCACSAEPVYR